MNDKEIETELIKLKSTPKKDWYKCDFDFWEQNKHLLNTCKKVEIDKSWRKPKGKSEWYQHCNLKRWQLSNLDKEQIEEAEKLKNITIHRNTILANCKDIIFGRTIIKKENRVKVVAHKLIAYNDTPSNSNNKIQLIDLDRIGIYKSIIQNIKKEADIIRKDTANG